MKIHELYSPSRRFLRSTQLERDFNDPQSLEGYVSTPEIEEFLGRIFRGLAPNSGQRAWRVTGDYGSGKSSFALLLASLASRNAGDLPKHLRHLLSKSGLSGRGQKLLPILVTGAREAISLVLLRSLNDALTTQIDGRLTIRSRNQISEALEAPEKIDETKVVQWVASAAKELHERGLFRGLLIVLDEMGKFLEFAALHPERQDVYFLQQLGEASARSGEACLFTVGLLHQGFSAYADKLSDAGQREWEKVAGRFEELVFSQPLGQVAELVSAALAVDPDKPEIRGWKTYAGDAMSRAVDLGLFGAAATKTALRQTAPHLYPLHPTVLPVLTRFFRRFGQNERSLFSFLLSSEPHGLQNFSTQEAGPQTNYRLAELYDFAAHNFGHRLSTQSFRSHWNHIDGIIRSYPADQSDELRVLKTIGILNTIEVPELQPTAEILDLALDDVPKLEAVLKRLSSRGTIYLRGRSGGYALWPHTSVNLEQAFIHASEIVTSVPSIAEAIRHRLEARPIVASRHYIETGNLRYFDVKYLTVAELETQMDQLQPKFPADGLIAVVLCETTAQRRQAGAIAEKISDQDALLIGLSAPLDGLTKLVIELERWLRVELQTPELKDDRYAAEEVSRQLALATQNLARALSRDVGLYAANNDQGSSLSWYLNGETDVGISSKESLQVMVSDICNELFNSAPTIHNELVNRNEISTAAASARQKLFALMLKERNDVRLGLPTDKAPPEKSMYLSVLQATGLHRQQGGKWDIRFPKDQESDVARVLPALGKIVEILERTADARITIDLIRDELRSAPYGVRDGLFPILLLVVLIEHEAEIAVYEDGRFVPEIEENLMMRLVKQPQTFELQLTRITGIRRELLEKFADVLSAHSAERAELVSIVRPLCAGVAELPAYVKQTDQLTSETKAVRDEITRSQEPADLIFNSIPRALGFSQAESALDASIVAKRLRDSLSELKRAYFGLQTRMAESILNAFGVEGQSLEGWRIQISSRAETVIVALTDPEFRAFVMKLTQEETPEAEWLEALGSILVRRPPNLWRDQDEAAFQQQITDYARRYMRVEATHLGIGGSATASAFRVALTRASGEEADQVVTLSAIQHKAAKDVQKSLFDQLPTDKKVALAALSQLMWELMRDER